MEYGCRIWDEQGYIMLDTTDYTARLVYSTTKAGNSSGSDYIPEADGSMPIVLTTAESGHPLVVGITTSGILTWEPIIHWDGSYSSGTTHIFVYVCNEKVI